ncbi:hypothetical protein HG430_002600 [Candidatus Gracilibacteria bacterium]|nr:hypothetical protein [Candidatus Gracilibacteria bacterium]
MRKKIKNAFTIIELVVVITLIIIIVFGLNSLNFGKLSDLQKSDIFSNKIIGELENVRNDALVGKGILDSTEKFTSIQKWKVEIDKNTGTITIKATPLNGTERELRKVIKSDKENIHKLSCVGGEEDLQKLEINFTGDKIDFSNCTKSQIKIVTEFNGDKNTISMDRISGLIKKEKK